MPDISKVIRITKGRHVTDGAGVSLYRIMPSYDLDHVDPFVLLDEFKSDDPDDYIAGFPMHPHRGIETITYMLDGSFKHKDSKGHSGVMTEGTVQWMTAGRGILHEEMPMQEKGKLWGFQLWLSLKAKDKMVEPRYQHLSKEMMPVHEEDGLRIKVISGSYMGLEGPAKNWVPSNYIDIRMDKGKVFEMDIGPDKDRFVYVHSGEVEIGPPGDEKIVEHMEAAILDNGSRIRISSMKEDAGFLLLAGIPNHEPIARGGPFVMNSKEEIYQAFEDHRQGKLHI